jgi:hypothetical protein
MRATIKVMIIVFFIFLLKGCKTEDLQVKSLDGIQPTTFYTADIISSQYAGIYGTWKVTGTSGGISGKGYTKDFDYLVFKKNGIFGIIRNDSLITYGKLTLLPDITLYFADYVYCRFDFEKPANIELYADSEKRIRLVKSDSLDLMAPCCDRYDTHLVCRK